MKYVFDCLLLMAIDVIVFILLEPILGGVGLFFAIALSTIIICFKLDQLIELQKAANQNQSEKSADSLVEPEE